MKVKKVLILLILCLTFICWMPQKVKAKDVDDIITGMSDVGKVTKASESKVSKVLNAVIKLIQVAGTGISVLMVTTLGIKYMIASSSEKAEIKKSAMPIIIGCALLFAAVNLVAIVASIGDSLNS